MTCSDFRELLSAHLDGESETADTAALHRHLAGCGACRAYEADALRLRAAAQRSAATTPDLTDQILGQVRTDSSPRARATREALRVGLVMVAAAELLASAFLFVRQQGYNGEDHAGHEALSFTVAVCAGLLYVASRPRVAASYLPVLAVAVPLLGSTAVIDVHEGRAGLLEELPHFNLLAALVIVWLLARSNGPGRRWPSVRSGGPRPSSSSPLRTRVVAVRQLRVLARAALGLLVGGLLVLAAAAPASAHATLESSDPAPDTVLSTAPQRVTLTFDEPVTLVPASVRVFGPDGKRVDDGVVRHPGGVGKAVTVGVRDAQSAGTYLISWRVISADSHPVSGAFDFSVRTTSSAPTAPTQKTDRTVAVLLGGSRFLGYAGCALFVGGLAFLALCWPGGRAVRGTRLVVLSGAIVSVVGAGAALLLKGPLDSALGLGSVGRFQLVRETLSTTYGHGVLARLVIAVAATAVLVSRPRGRAAPVLLGILAVALVATFPLTGHAVASDQRALALSSDLIHVAAMSVWLGGLVMVSIVLRVAPPVDALPVVDRFSRIALISVLTLVATGTYQAWRQVRVWGALTETTYGRDLLVKLGFVALTLAAASISRAWIMSSRTGAARASPAGSRIRLSVAAEVVLACGVLAVTSVLVATQPARDAYHPTTEKSLTLGPQKVQVSAVPDGDRSVNVHLYVFDKSLRPTDPPEVTAEASLPHHAIGPLPLKLYHVDVGHDVAKLSVPVAGDWALTVRVRVSDFDEYSKVVALPIR